MKIELPQIVKNFFRIVTLRDIWDKTTIGQKIRLIFSIVIFNVIEAGTKVLAPLALAKSLEMIAKNNKEDDFLEVTLSVDSLFFLSFTFTFISLMAPEVRKLFLYGLAENFSKELTYRLILESQSASLNIPRNIRGKILLSPTQKNISIANTYVSKLLNTVTTSIHPLLCDSIVATSVAFGEFNPEVGSIILGYIVIAIITNEAIAYFSKMSERSNRAKSFYHTFSQDWIRTLNNSEAVYLFNRMKLEVENALFAYSKYYNMEKGNSFREHLSVIQPVLISSIQLAASFYIAQDGFHKLGLSDIVFLLGYSANIGRTISTINSSYRFAVENINYIDEFDRFSRTVISAYDSIDNGTEDINVCQLDYSYEFAIEFENVSFHYDPLHPILDSLSFKIPSGKITAIVGSTNCGKTTITKLLCGFIKPSNSDAKIKIFGVDIKNIPAVLLRKIIGISRQEVDLFENESVKYNVCYGYESDENLFKMKNSEKNVDNKSKNKEPQNVFLESICQKTNLHHDLMARQESSALSGGEKQRIGIARILARDPEIFIFDEPTSQLDSETEIEVLRNIYESISGKTILMIAHRLSTVKNADQIIVLSKEKNNGTRLVEVDTHSGLIKRNGVYANYWYLQTASFDTVNKNSFTTRHDVAFLQSEYWYKECDIQQLLKMQLEENEVNIMAALYPLLRNTGNTIEEFQKLFKEILQSIFANDKLPSIIPINLIRQCDSINEFGLSSAEELAGNHWIGLLIKPLLTNHDYEIIIMDSLGIGVEKDIYIQEYKELTSIEDLPLQEEIFRSKLKMIIELIKMIYDAIVDKDISLIIRITATVQQYNGSDCGAFMVQNFVCQVKNGELCKMSGVDLRKFHANLIRQKNLEDGKKKIIHSNNYSSTNIQEGNQDKPKSQLGIKLGFFNKQPNSVIEKEEDSPEKSLLPPSIHPPIYGGTEANKKDIEAQRIHLGHRSCGIQ